MLGQVGPLELTPVELDSLLAEIQTMRDAETETDAQLFAVYWTFLS
jgi:hypothetical protein